jgi:hypothetical protein
VQAGRRQAVAMPPEKTGVSVRKTARYAGNIRGPLQGGHSHSAPGILLYIASFLMERAEGLLEGTISVPVAVRGAVLATDALELLGGRTPTAAIQALSLKHQFEVIAECSCFGVEYHLHLDVRRKEIQRDLGVIAKWFHHTRRAAATVNAELSILSELVLIFRHHAQFDEEQACLNWVRSLHATLWLRQSSLRVLLWPVIRYIGYILSSFSRFVTVLALWILLLSVLFSLHHGNVVYGIEDAITSFFSIGSPINHSGHMTKSLGIGPYVGIVCLAILAGFLHLGIFVSHLYAMVARK